MEIPSAGDLRAQFLNGNNIRLKDIYKSNYPNVSKILIAKKICGPQQIDDYYNEAIIIFYESVANGKFTDLKAVKSFLVGVCKNLAKRDQVKKTKIEKKEDELRLLFYKENDYSIDDNETEKMKRICYNAIEQLSNHCRRIILAFYIDRLSMVEIAEKFNLANSNVAKTMKAKCFKSLLGFVKSNSNS